MGNIDYNTAPEGLKEIPLEEWTTDFFCYCLPAPESRQVLGEQIFNLRMFDIQNFDKKKIGLAIMDDWYDSETHGCRKKRITRFCRYGLDEDWTIFRNKFAAQFSGDNS